MEFLKLYRNGSERAFLFRFFLLFLCFLFPASAAPVIFDFSGTVTQITDPYGSHLADALFLGEQVSYRIEFDLNQDGYYSAGGDSKSIVADEEQPGYSRHYFFATLVSSTYMHGDFPLVQYFLGRNEWPTGGNQDFMTAGRIDVGADRFSDVVIERSATSLPAYDPSYFIQNWVIGDEAKVEEQAWASGPIPNQPYQTSFSANMVLTNIESIPEPPTTLLTGLIVLILIPCQRRAVAGRDHNPARRWSSPQG